MNSRVGFSMSGTSEMTAGGGAEASVIVDKAVHNRVNYQEFYNGCGWVERRAVSFYAYMPASDIIATPHVNYGHCVAYRPGIAPWKSSGQNLTFGNGLKLEGLDLTTESGWNDKMEIRYRFSRNSWLCGSDAGPASARNLSAKPR